MHFRDIKNFFKEEHGMPYIVRYTTNKLKKKQIGRLIFGKLIHIHPEHKDTQEIHIHEKVHAYQAGNTLFTKIKHNVLITFNPEYLIRCETEAYWVAKKYQWLPNGGYVYGVQGGALTNILCHFPDDIVKVLIDPEGPYYRITQYFSQKRVRDIVTDVLEKWDFNRESKLTADITHRPTKIEGSSNE